jgi:hypothetical protein
MGIGLVRRDVVLMVLLRLTNPVGLEALCYGPHTKMPFRQLFYFQICILYCGNTFKEPLTSNGKKIKHIGLRDFGEGFMIYQSVWLRSYDIYIYIYIYI